MIVPLCGTGQRVSEDIERTVQPMKTFILKHKKALGAGAILCAAAALPLLISRRKARENKQGGQGI